MIRFDNDMNIGSIPSDSRLIRRANTEDRPSCGSKSAPIHYNESLHVAALFIILFLSTVACAFPIMARRFPSLPIPRRFLFLSRHFGTGVLLATAFVHLLPTAFVSLTDPCLPPFWNESYPPMAGFIALISVLVVVGVEMFFATRGAGHVHGGEYGMVEQEPSSATIESPREGRRRGHFRSLASRGSVTGADAANPAPLYTAAPSPPSVSDDEESVSSLERAEAPSDGQNLSRRTPGRDSSENMTASPTYADGHPKHLPPSDPETANTPVAGVPTEEQKLLLQCLLLEAGILFHSVFIGMALSVAVGTPFIVLLVAISFHQTFEGFALGSRIAAITAFGPKSIKPWLMALAYGVTTPIGQAIGLGVHNLYDPESEMGLIMVGIFNSMSSGLLLFAGLVELLAPDFLSTESYQTLQGRKRLEACSAVVAGSLLMALVGAWA